MNTLILVLTGIAFVTLVIGLLTAAKSITRSLIIICSSLILIGITDLLLKSTVSAILGITCMIVGISWRTYLSRYDYNI